jgi:hypothetical protein
MHLPSSLTGGTSRWARLPYHRRKSRAGHWPLPSRRLRPYGEALVTAIRSAPYLSGFPASLDPSPFPFTVRYRIRSGADGSRRAATELVGEQHSTAQLVYVTLGTVIGYLRDAPTALAPPSKRWQESRHEF